MKSPTGAEPLAITRPPATAQVQGHRAAAPKGEASAPRSAANEGLRAPAALSTPKYSLVES